MNTILQHRFLNIVSGGDLTADTDLRAVYAEFLVVLEQIVDTMESYSQAYRLLTSLEDILSHNNRPTKSRSSEVAYYAKLGLRRVRAELKLLERRVTNPELFVNYTDSDKHSELKWSGTATELAELLIAIDMATVIKTSNNEKMPLTRLIGSFEKFFDFPVGNPHDLKRRILNRKTKSSVFLDKLRALILNP